MSGLVWHGSIELADSTDSEVMHRLANLLNEELEGLPFEQIEKHLIARLSRQRDSLIRIYELAAKVVKESLKFSQDLRLFLEGSSHVFEKPEFEDVQKSRNLISIFNSKKELLQLFDETAFSEGIQVSIGRESRLGEMKDLALITSPYRLKDNSIGVLGILGPKRMDYAKVIPLVEYTAAELAGMLHHF